MQEFPQELVDMVIDYLHTDRRTLAACTLVCKTWRYEAQHHLFHTLRQVGNGECGYTGLLTRLDAAPPAATHAVRKIALTSGPRRCNPLPELDLRVIVKAFDRLPNLRSLKLDETGFNAAPHGPFLPHSRLQIEKLELNWLYKNTPGSNFALLDVLSLFSRIDEFHVGVIHEKNLPLNFGPGQLQILPVQVQSLHLTNISSPLFSVLKHALYPGTLRTVKALLTAPSDVTELGNLLAVLGSEVTHIHLALWSFWSSFPANWESLQLSHSSKLQSVTITYANPPTFYSWSLVRNILCALPPSITYLTLIIRELACLDSLDKPEVADDLDPELYAESFLFTSSDEERQTGWEKLDEAVSRFGRLRSLRTRMCKGGGTFCSREISLRGLQRVREGLPKAHEKGILRI